jgi:elongation factor G
VHQGSTVTDHLPQEQDKGITISAAAVTCAWREHQIQLADTPGHADFTIEVERSLRVVDGVVLLVDAVAGVEAQTEAVWRQATRHALPALAFVNKMDRPGADLEASLRQLEARLGVCPVLVTLPIGSEAGFVGVVDIVNMRALVWPEGGDGSRFDAIAVPAALVVEAARMRERLIEACADVDDALGERWLAGDPIDDAALLRALRSGTLARKLVPVLCGSAYRKRGVQPLLDAIVDLLPAPNDRPPVRSVSDGELRPACEDAPLAALCFKVVHDEYGRLSMCRVYSGVLRKGMSLQISRTGDRARVTRLVRLFAAEREEIEQARAGEIAGVLGMPLQTGDTLSDLRAPVVLEAIRAPRPVVRMALEPRTRADHDRMGGALARLLVEDPSLALSSDPDTGQTLLAGMGILHLEIAVDRLKTEHRVELTAGRPEVAYRETLRQRVEREVKHIKQTGGPGQYAHVVLRFEPGARGSGFVFSDATRGGVVPARFHSAIVRGVELAMCEGPLGGYPVVDVAVTLLDGSIHSDDSNEPAFETAAARAFREAAPLGSPVLLEPIMRLEVMAPQSAVGDVLGDLAARRGRPLGLEEREGVLAVQATVPLAETFGYAGALGALTHGRGSHTLDLEGYQPVPDAVARTVLGEKRR